MRNFISPVLEPAYSFLKRCVLLADKIRWPVCVLRGKEKWSNENLTVLCCAAEQMVTYLSSILYSGEPEKESLGKCFIWQVESRFNSEKFTADLIFIETDKIFSPFLRQRGFKIIPQWILFILEISRPLSEIWREIKNKSLSDNLRIVRKYQYVYEMTRDLAKYNDWYRQMYVPYALERFGDASMTYGFRKLKRTFERGQILFVKRDNDHLAGTLIVTHGKDAWVHSLGIRTGNHNFLKQGVVSASYYFTVLWAKEKGYEHIDFGHCRPFLNDGVFIYKKNWGMAVKKSNRMQSVLGLKVFNPSQGVKAFLANNPFVFIDRGKMKGFVLIQKNDPLTPGEVRSLFKKYYISGLDCLIINSPQGFTSSARETAAIEFPQTLYLTEMDLKTFFK